MARKAYRVTSKLPQAKRAMHDQIEKAQAQALNIGEREAESRLQRVNSSRGYLLPTDVEQEIEDKEARLVYDNWYGHFFEYGTTYIVASPFMRPAGRKMNKAFTKAMKSDTEAAIRRKAEVK